MDSCSGAANDGVRHRGYGATATRLTPDQKVGSSNLSGLTFVIGWMLRLAKDCMSAPWCCVVLCCFVDRSDRIHNLLGRTGFSILQGGLFSTGVIDAPRLQVRHGRLADGGWSIAEARCELDCTYPAKW